MRGRGVAVALGVAVVRGLRVVPSPPSTPPFTASRRALVGGACAAAVAFPGGSAVAAPTRGSPRPVAWRIAPGDPPMMQPYTGRAVESCVTQIGAADCVLLGVKRGDARDYALAADLVARLARATKRPVAVGLDAAPVGSEPSLASGAWPAEAAGWPAVGGDASFLQPVLDLQRAQRIPLIPLGIPGDAMAKIQRAGGIRALGENERASYVDDVAAFVRYAALPGFDVYVDRVIRRRYDREIAWRPDAPAFRDFFASSIVQDEAAATRAARFLRSTPGALLCAIVDEQHVKFGWGAPGRLRRLDVDVDDDATRQFAATTVLLNPTANSTLSTTTQLRLSLAVDKPAKRPCADYVWFSESPKPNLITHMLNPVDGQFKIDLGLSIPTQ